VQPVRIVIAGRHDAGHHGAHGADRHHPHRAGAAAGPGLQYMCGWQGSTWAETRRGPSRSETQPASQRPAAIPWSGRRSRGVHGGEEELEIV
jgi:hypothetical protein